MEFEYPITGYDELYVQLMERWLGNELRKRLKVEPVRINSDSSDHGPDFGCDLPKAWSMPDAKAIAEELRKTLDSDYPGIDIEVITHSRTRLEIKVRLPSEGMTFTVAI